MYTRDDFQHDLHQLQQQSLNFYRLEQVNVDYRHPLFKSYPTINSTLTSFKELHQYYTHHIVPDKGHRGQKYTRISYEDQALWAPFILQYMLEGHPCQQEQGLLQRAMKHFPIEAFEHLNDHSLLLFSHNDFSNLFQEHHHYPRVIQSLLIKKPELCLEYMDESFLLTLFNTNNGELWEKCCDIHLKQSKHHDNFIKNFHMLYAWKNDLTMKGIAHHHDAFQQLHLRLQNVSPIQDDESLAYLQPNHWKNRKHELPFKTNYHNIRIFQAYLHAHHFGPAVIKAWCLNNSKIVLNQQQTHAFTQWWSSLPHKEQEHWRYYVVATMAIRQTKREFFSLTSLIDLPIRKNKMITDVQHYIQKHKIQIPIEKATEYAQHLKGCFDSPTPKIELMLQYCMEQQGLSLHEQDLYL